MTVEHSNFTEPVQQAASRTDAQIVGWVAFRRNSTLLVVARFAQSDLGAAVTAILFVIGEGLIAWYLAVAGIASACGTAGSLLVGLLWIYYSAIMLLLGAEFTKVAAGHAQTVAPSNVRTLSEQPAGVDPRVLAKRGDLKKRKFSYAKPVALKATGGGGAGIGPWRPVCRPASDNRP